MRYLFAFAMLCGMAFGQCTNQCYVDPLYTGGSNNGTSTNPFTSIANAMTQVNTNVVTQNVTVFISASDPTNTTEQGIDSFTTTQRTTTGSGTASTNVITFDGMSKYQTNATHGTPGGGTWATNFIPPSPPTSIPQNYAKSLLNGGSGTVNTSGTTMTWVSGDQFNAQWASRAGTVNGSGVTISSCASPTTCTLGSSAGTQTGVTYTAAPILKAKMTGSVPLDSSNSFSNCKGFFVFHGLDIANNNGQSANLTYDHDTTLEYSEVHRIALGAGGPTVYIGPGQHGPCHTGAARPNGADSGPDNVTVQFNYIHEGWGESIYSGASTSDPFVNGAPGGSQQVEGGSVSGDNLQCGNGCGPGNPSCSTAVAANASTCSTGANYVIQGNTIESGAAWGGQGDGLDIKDGHTNLKIIGNSLFTSKFPACAPTCTNLACYGGSFSVTSVANASGGNTVYTGTFTGGGANAFSGLRFNAAGFSHAANNGTFTATASTATTLTLNNASGVADTGGTVSNAAFACTANNQCASNRCGAGTDGRAMIVESCSLIDSNFCQAPGHDCIDLGDSWNTSSGRAACQVSNNIITDVDSGAGHNNALELESLNVSGLAAWVNTSWLNNSIYNAGNDVADTGSCITSGSGGSSGTTLFQNNICQFSTSSGSFGVGTHDHNDYFQATGLPSGEGAGSVTTDPKYIATTSPYIDTNFKLQATSPILTSGANLFSTFINDYFGTPRPNSPFTIGAYQFTTVSSPPGSIMSTGTIMTGNTVQQ